MTQDTKDREVSLKSIYGLLPYQLAESMGPDYPSYRVKQLLDWIYRKLVFDPQSMTNIPQPMREALKNQLDFRLPQIDAKLVSTDGTIKYRLKLADDSLIEMVMIPDGAKRSLCVSSQVGCSRGCKFCATAGLKLKRNLSAAEIVAQVLIASHDLLPDKLSNLIFMGMGEPLDNLDEVLAALRILQDQDCLSFSPRRTTISTCGVIPGIIKLADSGIKTKLAVSLNSAIQAKRAELMPVATRYPLPELKQALLYFRRKTSFRITFEYILIKDFNMASSDIKALSRFVDDISSKLNFIPLNPVEGTGFLAPSPEDIEAFMHRASSIRQAITLRKSRGADIYGACGQLAAKKEI